MKVISAEIVSSTFSLDFQPACHNRNLFDWNKKDWRNTKDIIVKIRFEDGTTSLLCIPAFTVGDGSSVPFPLNALIPAVGPNLFAAHVHDYIYRNKYVMLTCGQADDIYYYLALQRKALAYTGLRVWNFLFKTNPNYVEREVS